MMSTSFHVDVPSFVLPSPPLDYSLVPTPVHAFFTIIVNNLSSFVKAEYNTQVTQKPFAKFWEDTKRFSIQVTIYLFILVFNLYNTYLSPFFFLVLYVHSFEEARRQRCRSGLKTLSRACLLFHQEAEWTKSQTEIGNWRGQPLEGKTRKSRH